MIRRDEVNERNYIPGMISMNPSGKGFFCFMISEFAPFEALTWTTFTSFRPRSAVDVLCNSISTSPGSTCFPQAFVFEGLVHPFSEMVFNHAIPTFDNFPIPFDSGIWEGS